MAAFVLISYFVSAGHADLLVNGIVLGSIISLGAISLSMVYGVLNFANLAHGDLMCFGAYAGILANRWLGLGIIESAAFAILLSMGLGMLLEEVLWKPLRRKGAGLVTFLIVSMGLAIVLRNSIIAIFGGSYHYFALPPQGRLGFFGITIGEYDLLVVLASLASMAVFCYVLQRTTLGKSMRALSDSPDLARISGINVDRVIVWMWVIAMALVGLAGVLYGVVTMVRPMMGFHLLLSIFAATILGGIGNVYGAMLGGMTLGLSQEISVAYIPAEYKMAVAFVILILVLILRPKGILRGLR